MIAPTASTCAPSYEIREFGGVQPRTSDTRDLATLHSQLLPHSPLVLMGRPFTEDFYYNVLPKADLICGAIAYVNNEPAAFIVATDDPDGFMSKAVRRSWFRLCWVVFTSLVRRPARILAMREAWQIQKNVESANYGPEFGELLSFGVLKEFRTRSFVKETGLSLAKDLQDVGVKQLANRGVNKIRAIVDKDNLEAQLFYRSNGWRVGLASVKGWRVPTMEFLLEIG